MTTAEIAPYAGTQLEEYRARMVMTPEDAKALDDQVRACTKAVLRSARRSPAPPRHDTSGAIAPYRKAPQLALQRCNDLAARRAAGD